MLRRTRRPAGLTGLPLRFVVSDGQDMDTPEPVDTKDSKKENSPEYNQPCQRGQERRPSTTEQNTDTTGHPSTIQQTRGRLGSDSSSTGLNPTVHGMDKENRFVYKTPTHNPINYINPHKETPNCTFPGVHESKNVSAQRSEQLRMTPSSTLPISIPQSNERTGKTRNTPLHSYNHANSQAHTPATSKLAQMNGYHHQPPQSASLLTDDDRSVPIHRSKSVPQQLGSISASKSHEQLNKQVVPHGKPPLNITATNQQPVTQPVSSVRTPSVGSPPELDSDVVVMKSQGNGRRYKKLKLLGTGGSSKVFKVVGENYQTYALKEVYIKHVDPAIKEAYINEIKLLKRLNGRQEIITLYDYTWDRHEGVLYLLLEYAEMDLNAVIKSANPTNHMATVLYFWNQMLQVVKVIHEEGVVHNDLKPENFVCIGARLRLIDFGISKRIEEEKTSFERDMRCGTINYMAPETIETHNEKDFYKVGRPSDVWSLGCILYLLVYGRTPFEHIKNKLKKWQAIIDPSVAVPFPELQNKAAIDIMQKCLCRNPKQRPTIDELIAHPFSQCLHQD